MWILLFLNSVQRGILVSRSIAVERVPSIGKTTFCLEAILTSHLTMSDWRWGHQIMPIFYYFRCFTQCKVVLYFNGWSFDKWCSCWSYFPLFWLQHFPFPNWNISLFLIGLFSFFVWSRSLNGGIPLFFRVIEFKQ